MNNPQHDPRKLPPEGLPRKPAIPLLWIVLLLMLLALVWFAYTRFAGGNAAVRSNTPPAVIGSEMSDRQAAAQAEREQADAASPTPAR